MEEETDTEEVEIAKNYLKMQLLTEVQNQLIDKLIKLRC